MSRDPFGAFRRTSDFVERPPTSRFRPRLRISAWSRRTLADIERLDREVAAAPLADDVHARVLRESLARNGFGTASLEGNPLSLEQVESLLRHAPSGAAGLPDEKEILRHARLMRDPGKTRLPGSVAEVRLLHRRYFSGILAHAGRLKQEPNAIGDGRHGTLVYLPTAPGRVEAELQRALDWLRSSDAPGPVRAAVFFHEFQSIHPFADGNGRLGRLLAHIQMHHLGFKGFAYAPVDFLLNQRRDEYYAALQAARQGAWDLTPWLEFWLAVVRDGYLDARTRLLLGHVPAVGERAVRIAEWFARLDPQAKGAKAKVADVQAAFPQLPRRTVQRALAELAAAGLLEVVGAGRGAAYRRGRLSGIIHKATPQRYPRR